MVIVPHIVSARDEFELCRVTPYVSLNTAFCPNFEIGLHLTVHFLHKMVKTETISSSLLRMFSIVLFSI